MAAEDGDGMEAASDHVRPSSSSSVAPWQGGGPGGGNKEKKVSDKDLDLTNANRGVWLVKVPKYIADRWESVEPNSEVGRLRISRKAASSSPGSPHGGKPSVSVTLTLDDKVAAERKPPPTPAKSGKSGASASSTSAADPAANVSGISILSTTTQKIPKDHRFLVASIQAQHLAVFSHTSGAQQGNGAGNGGGDKEGKDKLSLEGKVVQRAECRPDTTGPSSGGSSSLDSNKAYMAVKREALLKPLETARKAQQLDRVVNKYKPISNHASNIAYEKKMKNEGKKSRDDKDRVLGVLFALFEKHQYYNIKDLVRETRQPVTYLKTILNEVCRYNLKNPHKNMWELKPEYRHYKDEDGKDDKDDGTKDGDGGGGGGDSDDNDDDDDDDDNVEVPA